MTGDDYCQRINGNELIDAPKCRHKLSADNHGRNTPEAKDQSSLEVFQDLRDLGEECCVFGFFAGGAPGRVNREHM